MAGVCNKDIDFWNFIKEKDFVNLSETWVEEERWMIDKNRMPETHEWYCFYASREKIKGRAKGGFIIGWRKGMGECISEQVKVGMIIGNKKK